MTIPKLNNSDSFNTLFLAMLTGFVFASTPAQPSVAQNNSGQVVLKRYEALKDTNQIADFSFERFFTKDKFRRKITFYLSKARSENEQPLPLVICIQGSGSQSVFMKINGKIVSGGTEAVALREYGDRVRVLVVEKPGVEFLVQPSRPGSSEEGSKEFNQEFSLSRWVEALNAATEAALTLPGIDHERILAMGHSEGAQVACALAAANAKITHVAALAGGGPTQLHDLIQFARRGDMYDPNKTADQRVGDLLADWQRVLDNPLAHDQFVLGHSHLRWSSFLKVSPIETLRRSKALVYIAQGTRDTNSLPESAEMLYAELLAQGRDVTYERVEGGDHAFMTEDDKTGAGWFATNAKVVRWFLGDK